MTERELFIATLRQPDERAGAAFLATASVDEPLRERVKALVKEHADLGSFLESPAVPMSVLARCPRDATAPGTVIGPYTLLEQIGEGGMGDVYAAEQTQPVRRKVALKVVKPGMDTKQVVARFEAERQALALMEHPNIARVIDGGTAPNGRPFFVMELVHGVPLTEYCDGERLSIRDRLDLFVLVCRAVQHAHQKGIIHRDLKPSNILVTVIDGAAVPKVIDFGVAKAIGGSLTDRTLHTGIHQFVGTPLYMSPEQADLSGVDVDTRSDIYSLGVLLYELLTGTTPFDEESFRKAAFDELRRIIREEEPPRPSARLSTLADQKRSTVSNHRQTEPRCLNRSVRGELDWIVMRCLEKDPGRRYDSASALAGDLVRFLKNEPVEAGPPSRAYRFRKFARRNRLPLGLAALGLLVFTLAGQGLWQAERLRRAAEITRIQAETIEQRDRIIREGERRKRAERYANDIQGAARLVALGDVWHAHALLETLGVSADDHPRGYEWRRLERLCRGKPLILGGHQGDVYAAVFSPDGTMLATCGKDGTVHLRDSATGETRRILGPVGTELNQVAFTPDGTRLASCGDDSIIRIWALGAGDLPILTINGHQGEEAVGVLFTPDGRWLISYGRDEMIRRWDAATGQLSASWKAGGDRWIESCGMAREGTTLLIGNSPYGAILHDWAAARRLERLAEEYPRDAAANGSVALTADGRLAAFQSDWKELVIWSVRDHRLLKRLQGHHGRVYSLAFSPDGRKLTSLGEGELRLWNLPDGTSSGRVTGHEERSWCVNFSPDGRRLATTGREGTVRIWDLDAWAERIHLRGCEGVPRILAFAPDDRTVTLYCHDGAAMRWDVGDGAPSRSEIGPIQAAVSADGQRGAAFRYDRQWIEVAALPGASQVVQVHSGTPPSILTLSRDGHMLDLPADSSLKGQYITRVVDVASGKEMARHHDPENEMGGSRCVAFSSRSGRLAGRTEAGRVWCLALGTGEESKIEFNTAQDHNGALAFSPDGTLLATGGPERRITLLDAVTLEVQATLVNHSGTVCGLAFAPDGRTLASAAEDGTVRLWSVATGQEFMKFDGHSGPVRCVQFSHDGRMLASAAETHSGEAEVILWPGAPTTNEAGSTPGDAPR